MQAYLFLFVFVEDFISVAVPSSTTTGVMSLSSKKFIFCMKCFAGLCIKGKYLDSSVFTSRLGVL